MISNKNLGGEVSHLVRFPTLNRDQSVFGKATILDSSAQPVMGEARNDGHAVGLSSRKFRDKFSIKMIGVDVRDIDSVPPSRQKLLIFEAFERRKVIPRA
jgi:hypothetical protein